MVSFIFCTPNMETEDFTFVSDLFNLVKYLTGQVVMV